MLQTIIAILSILLIQSAIFPNSGYAVDKLTNGDFQLIIDENRGASVFYKDILLVREIGSFSVHKYGGSGYNEFARGPYRNENRNQIINKSVSGGVYQLSGRHRLSGAEYQIQLKWVRQGRLKVDLTMDTKDTKESNRYYASVSYLKLVPDVFRGSRITGEGVKPRILPLTPKPPDDRFLLNDASSINIASYMTDISIHLPGDAQINLADFRSVRWDPSRSFYLYSNKLPANSENRINFSYEIQFMPPSMKLDTQFQDPMRSKENTVPDGKRFFHFEPRSIEYLSGHLSLGPKIWVRGDLSKNLEAILTAEIVGRIPRGIYIDFSKDTSVLGDITIHLNKKEKGSLPVERFEVEVTREGVAIQASDDLGCLFALQALLDKARIGDTTMTLPFMKIKDWPDIKVRGMHIEIPSKKIDIRYIKGYIHAIARSRGNTIIMFHTSNQIRMLMSGVMNPESWSAADLREIADYARSLGITVIPGMEHKFSAKNFPNLIKDEGQNFYNPLDSNSYKVLFAMYAYLLELYHPKAMLVGHDEIVEVGKNAPRGWTDAKVLAFDVSTIHDWLKQRGIRTLMFGDMLLDNRKWESLGAANSNNSTYKSSNTHEATDLLPKDIVILDWHYSPAKDFPTVKYFKDKGFEVWGVPWYSPENACNMAQSISNYSADGLMGSDWGLLGTLSPGATTLYALKSAWNTKTSIQGNGEDALAALTDEMRQMHYEPSSSSAFRPVQLEQFANETTWDEEAGDGRGFFDLGKGFDLRAFPEGDQILGNISFAVAMSKEGKKNNSVIVGSRYAGSPLQKDIPTNSMKVRRLAFLHTMYARNPQISPRLVGTYEIVYASGRKTEINLRENFNITDFRSSPGIRESSLSFTLGNDFLIGSNLAWRGATLSGIPVNVQLLLWDNPYPYEAIRFIRINSVGQAQICLLALSVESL